MPPITRTRGASTRTRRTTKQSSLNHSPTACAYEPLDLQRRQIRILRLLPGRRDDIVRGTLYTAYLDDGPSYEALSYVWGDALICRPISIDGRIVDVTVNLEAALRRLRRRRRHRHLWVDALCINQADGIEKSHQVNLMKEIYSNTTRAVLWLGDFSDGPLLLQRRDPSHETRASPCRAVEEQTSLPNPSAVLPRRTVALAFGLLRSMAAGKHYDTSAHEDPQNLGQKPIEALNRLSRLPWWERIWTAQESILPQRAILQCGTMKITMSTFVKAYRSSVFMHRQGCCGGSLILRNFWAQTHSMIIMRTVSRNQTHFSLALNLFRYRLASDPRDKVFALLGLGGTMWADYSLSEEETFCLVMHDIISKSRYLSSLVITQEMGRSPELPTWVPDWRVAPDIIDGPPPDLAWVMQYSFYNAAGGTLATIGISSSQSVLKLKGVEVDQIREVGNFFNDLDQALEIKGQWQDMNNRTCKLHHNVYPRKTTYDEAFWRTMTMDLVNKRQIDKTMVYRRANASDEVVCTDTWELNFGTNQIGPPCAMRRFFVTETGMIGFGLRNVRAGDAVHVLWGGNMPFVLRPVVSGDGDGNCYEYVGQAYVHGIMDGEVVEEGREPEWIKLQ